MTATADAIRYDMLPMHMREGAQMYIERGICTGNFLLAVLKNDLVGAACQADDVNRECLLDWARWLWNEAPRVCWGTPQRVAEWQERGGLFGIEAEGANDDA